MHSPKGFILHQEVIRLDPACYTCGQTHNFRILVLVEYIESRAKTSTQNGGVLRDDGQPTSKIRQPNFRRVNSIHQNTPLRCFDETEERQSQRALSGSSSSQDSDLIFISQNKSLLYIASWNKPYLFSRFDLEVEVMKDIW